MEVTRNETAPHRAVLWVEATVHELMPTGECHGHPASKIVKFPLVIDGADRWICERKLNEALAELKEKCKSQGT